MPKRKIRLIVLGIVFLVIFSLVSFIRSQYVVPILMYHSVSPDAVPENRLSVSVISFNRQMHFLKRYNYNVITLEEFADLARKKEKIPPRTVILTFDDGYKDNFTYAFPILQRYGLRANMFIIVNEVGRPEGDRLSWDDIRIMRNSGLISFGSHCLGPEPLTNIESEEVRRREIFDSRKMLEERLGRRVTAFSYPEGKFNDRIKRMVMDAGYTVAVTTNPGKEFPNDDLFALKRLRISSTSDSLFVFWVESSGYYNFMREHRHK